MTSTARITAFMEIPRVIGRSSTPKVADFNRWGALKQAKVTLSFGYDFSHNTIAAMQYNT
jgi:hypothetical protein